MVCQGPSAVRISGAARRAGVPVSLAQPSQCGPTADYTPINAYDGEIAHVQEREDAVALLAGNCTGTLIAAAAGPVLLTAGHCVALGDAGLIAFNVEDDADGDALVTGGTVIERADVPDYALIELDAIPAVTPTPLTTQLTDVLAVIQHPRSRRKVIAVGELIDACDSQVYYADLDTEVGSSGAGLLNASGDLVAIHTDGDCGRDGGGSNFGWTSESIVAASSYLVDADLAPR